MFHFKTNVSFQNKCFASKQMFSFQNDMFRSFIMSLTRRVKRFLRLIPSAYNQVATALPPCFVNSAIF